MRIRKSECGIKIRDSILFNSTFRIPNSEFKNLYRLKIRYHTLLKSEIKNPKSQIAFLFILTSAFETLLYRKNFYTNLE